MHTQIAIIGTGFAGLGTAIHLQKRGLTDFVLLEEAASVGGTWRDNTYPGCACDVPSHLYSFSFELNPNWSRQFAPQDEIRAYIEHCAEKYGLMPRIEFNSRVEEARWDEDDKLWRLSIRGGRTLTARFVVFCLGGLREPRFPQIPGRDSFAGPTMHSTRWRHDVDLKGLRVGVIGTGASAIQVVPGIAERTGHLTLFQRTAAWVRPRQDAAISPRRQAFYRRFPLAMQLERARIYARYESRWPLFKRGEWVDRLMRRLMEKDIRRAVRDTQLADKLIPAYKPACKRVLLSDDFYPALQREDVDLEVSRIVEIVPDGAVLADGRKIELDAIVYCTGFEIEYGQVQIYGNGGVNLIDYWDRRPRAYLGLTVPGFPNSFTILGPNTALGHNSVIVMIEAGIRYTVAAIEYALDNDLADLDLREDALAAFVSEVDSKHRGLVWASGCDSWYLGEDGVNFTLWPGSTLAYIQRTRHFDPSMYRSTGAE